MSSQLAYATATRAARGGGQDRVALREMPTGLLAALADGAGGVGGGEAAAQSIVDAVQAWDPTNVPATQLIATLDRPLATTGGQSTAVNLFLSADGIAGASVGDSGAWIVHDDSVEDLTQAQNRKPLVGTGSAFPVPFATGPLADSTLLLASDGLLKYTRQIDIARIARHPDLNAAAAALVELVTLPSGEPPDDVTVILCRRG